MRYFDESHIGIDCEQKWGIHFRCKEKGVFLGESVVTQYTGLNDKNDKNIYEGDILNDNYERWFVVFWKENEASFWIRKYNDDEIYPLTEDVKNEMQIIGNIFENPELLKKA